MKFVYFKTYFQSFKEIFNNPVLLLPQIYLFLTAIIYLVILVALGDGGTEQNTSFLIVSIIVLVAYVLFIILFYGTNLKTFRLFVDKKKVTPGKQFAGGTELYWKVLGIWILKVIVIGVPVAVLIFLASLISPSTTTPSVLLIIAIVISLIYAIYMSLGLMFGDVYLTEKNNSAKKALLNSFSYFKKETRHVVRTALTILLISFFYIIIVYVLSGLIFGFNANTGDTTTALMGSIFTSLLSIPLYSATILFLFRSKKAV